MAKRQTDPIEQQAREILARPYSWVVVPDETGAFNGEILEFPGCFAQGNTPAEAYAHLEEAALGWIQDVLDRGESVPAPLRKADHSGKLLVRLPRSLHSRIAKIAAREGVSLNHFISNALAEKVAGTTAPRPLERGTGATPTVVIYELRPTQAGADIAPTIYGAGIYGGSVHTPTRQPPPGAVRYQG